MDNVQTLKTMQAVQLREYSDIPSLHLIEKPIPTPGPGQVLVKVAVSPLNPADVMFAKGRYISQKRLPVVPGMVASGCVVKHGGGLLGRYLLGKRVCCAALAQGDGAWSEYMVTDALRCFPLSKAIDMEVGCNILANPVTAWALLARVKQGGHSALVLNAAGGELPSMLRAMALSRGIGVINIVRTDTQKAQVLAQNVPHASPILNSTDRDFSTQLREHCRSLGATIALDAVAGTDGGVLMQNLPVGSELVVYGRLSGEVMSFDGLEILANRGLRLSGFSIVDWFDQQSIVTQLRVLTYMQYWMKRHWVERSRQHTTIRGIGLWELIENFDTFGMNTTQGKTLIYPS